MDEHTIRMPANSSAARAPRTPPHFLRMPAEGDVGVFTQSWFPVALGSEVLPGQILGLDFLDGKIVVFRAPDGTVRAMSAYCPHVGADLSVGKIVDGRVQCAFHHWEYDADGYCVKTGIGDPPPKSACLFMFPVQERFGIVWVFNGEEPLFDLPQLPYADSELVSTAYRFGPTLHCDPWIFAANTPDMQHLKVVHKIKFEAEEPHELVKWYDFGFEFSYRGLHQGDVPIENTAGIRGTSVFYRWGMYDGFWRCNVTGFSLPRPGQHNVFSCSLVLAGPKSAEHLESVLAISRRTVGEDKDILNTIHYRQGLLTRADKSLGKFLNYIRKFPRAHPSAGFIN
jgi:phenylpropionate dioxygenase-like ring-hydroxylating dioxygenase large terminal subunit